MCAPLLFLSDSQTVQRAFGPARRGASVFRGQQVGGLDGGRRALTGWGVSRDAGAGRRVCDSGRGRCRGSPWKGQAQPRRGEGGLGAQAKPCGWAPSSPTGYTRRSTCQPRHLPGGADGGWVAQTSVSSPVGVWCRGHGRVPDRTSSAWPHGGAGFVSQAILYFNFRCIS